MAKDYDTLPRRVAKKVVSDSEVGTVFTASKLQALARESGAGLISDHSAIPVLEWLADQKVVRRVKGPDRRKLYFCVCQPPCVRNRSSHRDMITLGGTAKCDSDVQQMRKAG